MKPKTEIETKVSRALEELKRARDELRVKMNLLGKEAGDVLEDAEEVRHFIEKKLSDIGEAAVEDAKAALVFVKERLDRITKEIETRRAASRLREGKPSEPSAEAKPPGA